MKEQLSELFIGMVFKFKFYSEGIDLFESTIMKDMAGNFKDFEIEVFTGQDGQFFFGYETFDSLIDRFQLFEVRELMSGERGEYEVLFHEKYKGKN